MVDNARIEEMLSKLTWVDKIAAFVWIGLTILIVLALRLVILDEKRIGLGSILIISLLTIEERKYFEQIKYNLIRELEIGEESIEDKILRQKKLHGILTLPEVLNRLVITAEMEQFVKAELEEWLKIKNKKHKKLVKYALILQEILKKKGFSLNLLLCEGMVKKLVLIN